MITIAYYTDDDIYSEHAEMLANSLDKVGIIHDISKIDQTSWEKATAFKPKFILDKIIEYREPVLYIDVDTIVHSDYRKYFMSLSCDVCMHITKEDELLSGTLYFNDTENSLRLLKEWKEGMKKNPDLWDQKVLQEIIEEKKIDNLDVGQLPSKYIYIFDKSEYDDVNKNAPVIEHLQASREVGYRKRQKKIKYKILGLFGIRPSKGTRLNRRMRRMAKIREMYKRK